MEQLYLLEILIETIEIIENDAPKSLVKNVKANVKCAKVINFTVEEKPETYELTADFNSGKSILFPMTKDKMLKLMKTEKISVDIMDISKKKLVGTASIAWPASFQSIVKDIQIKKQPVKDQSSYDLTIKGPPAKKGGKITALKVGTLKLYMVFNVFGKIIEVDFQLMNKDLDLDRLKETRQGGNSNVAIKKTSSKKDLKAASEPWQPLFVSAHNERQSFIEPELRIFAELAGIAIGPSWADKLTPDFISRKLCGGKHCPGAVKFRELGIGPLAEGTCLGSIGAVNKTKPEGVYGVSQAYGTMDDYGAFGLFVKDKKPIEKTCGSPQCPYAIRSPDDNTDSITDDGYQCGIKKPKKELVVTNSVIDKYAHIKCTSADCPFETANLRTKCADPQCPFAKLQNSLAKIKTELHSITKFKDEIPLEKHQNSPSPSHESAIIDNKMRKSCGCHNLLIHTQPEKNTPQCTNPGCCRRQSAGADRDAYSRRSNAPINEECSLPSCPYAPPRRASQTVDADVGTCGSARRSSQIGAEYRDFKMPKLNDYSINDTSCDIPKCYYYTEKPGRSQPNYPSSSNQQRTAQPGPPECPYANQGVSSYPSTSRSSPPQPQPPRASLGGQAKCRGPTCPYNKQMSSSVNQQKTEEANCGGQICPYSTNEQPSERRASNSPNTCGTTCPCSCLDSAQPGPSQRRQSYSPTNPCGGPSCPYSADATRQSVDPTDEEFNCEDQSCPYYNIKQQSNLSNVIDSRRISLQLGPTGETGPLPSYTSTNRCEDATCPSNQSQRYGDYDTMTCDSFSKQIPSDYATAGSFNDSSWTSAKRKDQSKSLNNYLSYEDYMTTEADVSQRKPRKHKEKKKPSGPCEKESCKIMKYPTCSECGGISRSGATCDNSKVSFSTISYNDVSCPFMGNNGGRNNMPVEVVKVPSVTKKTSMSSGKRLRNQRFVHNVGESYPGFRVAHRTCYIATGPNVPWNMGWLWSTPAEPGLRKRKGWRPGVLGKTINDRILARRRELGIPDPPELKMLGSRKKSKYPKYEAESESEDEIDFNPKPTLTIQKKDGQYLITMHPLKDPKTLDDNEYPYIKCAPMQFAIIKPKPEPDEMKLKHDAICAAEDDEYFYEDCLCDEDKNMMDLESLSSDSELNIEFTTPAGLIYPERLRRLPNVVHTDTQFRENDVNCSDCAIVIPNKYKKDKKKGKVRMR